MDTTIVSVAADYQVALRRINVSLPIELIEELLDLMGQLKDAGKVRQSDNKQHSVLDFIGNVVEKTGPRVVWKRLLEAHPDTVTFCNSVKLPRIDGKKGNLDSPVTNELGLMTIAYLLPGKLGDRIRKASAQLVVEALAGYRGNLDLLFAQSDTAIEQVSSELLSRIGELEAQLQTAKYPFTWTYLHSCSGIVSKYQVRDAIVQYFVEGEDYRKDGKEWYLSPSVFYILLVSFRSLKGTDTSELPKFIVMETQRYFRFLEQHKANQRLAKKYVDPNQLALFNLESY